MLRIKCRGQRQNKDRRQLGRARLQSCRKSSKSTPALAAEVTPSPAISTKAWNLCKLSLGTRYQVLALQSTHISQKLAIRLSLAKLINQQLHRFHRRQRIQHLAQHPDPR